MEFLAPEVVEYDVALDVGNVIKHITVYVEVTCYQFITILKIFVAFQITYTRIYRASTGSESLSCPSLV